MLALEGLSHGYAGRPIFDNFSLSLADGDHSLLIGPSGSGKTTLINLIAGLLTPDRGRILVDGASIGTLPAAARDDLRRRKIGIIFQTLQLVSALSVRANLALAQRLAGARPDENAIMRLLEAVGIGHRADAKPRQLSQGEAQRAAIARALITRPRLLIADEPTSALDDSNAQRVGQLLLDTAKANGSTLLIATHDARLTALIPTIIPLQSAAHFAATGPS